MLVLDVVRKKINIKYYIEIEKLTQRFTKKGKFVRAYCACGLDGNENKKKDQGEEERERQRER